MNIPYQKNSRRITMGKTKKLLTQKKILNSFEKDITVTVSPVNRKVKIRPFTLHLIKAKELRSITTRTKKWHPRA